MLHMAKITSPSHECIVPRERLFRRLDSCLQKQGVVWIASPGGSGKTSLAASYLNHRKLPHLWYRIDSGDDDPATFFYYMGLASKKVSPRFKKPLPLLTPEYFEGIPAFTRRYFEEMFRRLKAPFVLVFDNGQDVPETSPLHESLKICFETLPKGISVMIVSRNAPPPAYARIQLNSTMNWLDWNDIRLDREETESIVRWKNNEDIGHAPVDLVHERTGGWVAGLVLLMESLRNQGAVKLAMGLQAKEEIFPYFASELFNKTDPAIREFLVRTCFLPVMTADMARALTGNPESEAILKKLFEHGYFTERRLEKGANYLYHTLFRDFLLDRATVIFSDATIRDIRKKAAAVLMKSQLLEDAANLLMEAEDFQALTTVIREHAPNLLAQGRSLVLVGWLDAFPDDCFSSDPWLSYWKGAALFSHHILESRVFHERAFHAFSENGDETGVLLSWAGVVDTYLFESNDYKPLDAWLRWLDVRMGRNPGFPSVETEAQVLSSIVSGCLFRQPTHPCLRFYVYRLLEIFQNNPTVSICPQTLSFTVLFYIWMGKFDDARIALEYLKKKAGSPLVSPIMKITLKMIEAHYAVLSGAEPGQVYSLVEEGANLAALNGIHYMDFFLHAQEGYGLLIHREGGLNDAYLSRFDAVFKPEQRITHCLNMDILALNELHKGNYSNALIYAKNSEALCIQFGLVYNEGTNGVLLAQIYHELGDEIRALDQVKSTEEIFSRMGSRYFFYSCSLVKAYIHLERGNDREGLLLLRQALAQGREGRFANAPYVWRRNVICRLCIKALEAGIEIDFVRAMIRKQNLRPALAPVDIETWPWPVRIYTLGRFNLVINDQPVNVSGKTQKKPLLLLKALIALGGRDIKEETLTDLLWPDAEGDAGHNAFTTTLARLRKLIGDDSTIQLSGGRVSLDNRICWVDRWAFERLCSRTETILEKIQNGQPDVRSLKTMASKVAGLYKGPFLASDEDQPWTVATRERLRGKFLHLTSQAGTFLTQEGDDEAAIRYFQKGLEAEPLAEYLHQSLISAYLRLDRLAEALAAFKQCRKILDSHSIPLSQKTQALRRQIHKN